ncbi:MULTISPECIES: helix-turn-helix domain-containing protein [Rhodanobacter]|uniref:helix-turn-helix domain-containing protein n=1 Tax=Rhodanobacter TaxID=75309 RepID=UPI0003F6B3C9|nr:MULTISPECIES: helix-turn-helix domain-containing protein [Rhodanobacter]TAN19699.1 MAG: transcriptional regulator [Rhodanobacter sp.]UJJ55549.1 helix-turn-helix domain-containing protein [Rhodanobacter thiooxydans]
MSPYGDSEAIMFIRTPQDIGALLRESRKKAGLGQAELARRIGVSRQWVVEVERGKPRAEMGLVLRALNTLDNPLQTGLATLSYGHVADTPDIDIDAIIDAARQPQ